MKTKFLISLIFLMAAFFMLTNSCKKEEDRVFMVGDNYGGGIIFYVDYTGSSGKHGLIAAMEDQINAPWGCLGTDISTRSARDYGQQNTNNICENCSTESIAARVCNQLVLNGFDDWFLPSKDELILMREVLFMNGLGNFKTDAPYWTSTQSSAETAYALVFTNAVGSMVTKNSAIRIRAVRAF